MNVQNEHQHIELEHLVYTWAEQTLTGSGHGVVLRSSGWPTTNDIGSDATLANLLEYVPSKFLHRLADNSTPPDGLDFWDDPEHGHVVAVRRYLGNDSAGRPGRFLVHLLLNKARQLTGQTAYFLTQSQHIIRDWPFTAQPVRQANPIVYVPTTATRSESRTDSESLRRVIGGIIEIIGQGQRITFTQVQNTKVQDVLGAALAILPAELTQKLTFSTYRGVPSRGSFMLSFASSTFSDPAPTSQNGRLYVPLESDGKPAPANAERSNAWPFTAKSNVLSAQLIALKNSAEPFPPGLVTLRSLEEWLEIRSLAHRPVNTLSMNESATLLRLPVTYSTLINREKITERIAELAGNTSVELPNPGRVLELLQPAERSTLEDRIHSTIVNQIERAPAEAKRLWIRASAMGFSDDRLGQHAVPAIARLAARHQLTLNPSTEELMKQLFKHIGKEHLVEWAENPAFHSFILNLWEPTAHTIAERLWSSPGWFSTHPVAARGVASRFREESIQVLTKAISCEPPVLAPISTAIQQDYAQGSTVLTDILLTASRNPRIPAWRLSTLADQREMPEEIRDQLQSIAQERRQPKAMDTVYRAPNVPYGSRTFAHTLPNRWPEISVPAQIPAPFTYGPASAANVDEVDEEEVDPKHTPTRRTGKFRALLRERKVLGHKLGPNLARTSQPIASILCAFIGYIAGSASSDMFVALIAAVGVITIAITPNLLRRRRLYRRLRRQKRPSSTRA